MYAAVRSSKADTSQNFTRQGSLRRVIQAEHHENVFGRQNEDLNKIYKSFHQEYVILAEYKMLQSENIKGIYVIPSKESPFVWFGVIFVRSGPYEDGIFRFNIVLDETFPDSDHPKVTFLSEIYHPVINPENNELYLLGAFPNWNKSEQHIWFKNNQDAFKEKIKEIIKTNQEHLYDPPPVDDKHYLIFEQYSPEMYDQIKSTMRTQNEDDNTKVGYSWVLPGSFKPLSRPPSPDSESES